LTAPFVQAMVRCKQRPLSIQSQSQGDAVRKRHPSPVCLQSARPLDERDSEVLHDLQVQRGRGGNEFVQLRPGIAAYGVVVHFAQVQGVDHPTNARFGEQIEDQVPTRLSLKSGDHGTCVEHDGPLSHCGPSSAVPRAEFPRLSHARTRRSSSTCPPTETESRRRDGLARTAPTRERREPRDGLSGNWRLFAAGPPAVSWRRR
jgi:hypothetical protein